MRQEFADFSKKQEKIVVGKGRAFTVMWTHIQKVIWDPRPESWSWIPNGHTPFSPIAWWDAMIMPRKQLVRFCLWISFQHNYFHPVLNIWTILEARGTYFPAGQEMTTWGPLVVSGVTASRHHGSNSTIWRRKPLPLCQVLFSALPWSLEQCFPALFFSFSPPYSLEVHGSLCASVVRCPLDLLGVKAITMRVCCDTCNGWVRFPAGWLSADELLALRCWV